MLRVSDVAAPGATKSDPKRGVMPVTVGDRPSVARLVKVPPPPTEIVTPASSPAMARTVAGAAAIVKSAVSVTVKG
jgi:hypothetical protein